MAARKPSPFTPEEEARIRAIVREEAAIRERAGISNLERSFSRRPSA